MGIKEATTHLKSELSGLLHSEEMFLESEEEILEIAINILDTLLMKCISEDGKVTNRIWVKTRFLEVCYKLSKSEYSVIHEILEKIQDFLAILEAA